MNLIPVPLAINRFYEIVLYPQAGILGLAWQQPPSPSEYQRGTAALLEAVHQHHAKKLLSDNSRRGNPMPQDLVWMTHEVVPFLCDQAVQQLALVVPEDPSHARNLEGSLMTSKACYELQFFQCHQEALAWLSSSSGEVQE
ncbi:hypothetical protein [Rufibacter radiotolerans]|nr:hypothetical protein [Rufibacter radiotolerans]